MPLLLAAVLLAFSCDARTAGGRPNVVVVLADDLNDWVGALTSHPNARTPNIDRLALQGVLFRQAYAASPKCNPSRTALLLGVRPSTSGIYDNGHWWRPHLPGAVTLPEAFRSGGYLVAGGGKVFHHTAGFNPPDIWDEYFPLRFDDPWDRRGDAYPGAVAEPAPAGHPLSGINPFRHELDWGALPIAQEDYGDDRTVEWAVQFLRRPHDRPFLLVVGLFHPHLPWYAPAEFFESLPSSQAVLPELETDDLQDVPDEGRRLAALGSEVFTRIRTSGMWPEAIQAYVASISFADRLVGRLMNALDESPHAGNTVVVFASDHGFHLGEKQHWYKSTLWERSTHVPLIVRGPGIAPGTVCDVPVSLLDIYPTLIDLAGLHAGPGLEGRSLGGLLADPDSEPDRHAVITFLRGNDAVRHRQWLYIRYRDGGEELYDRSEDPNEFNNLANRADLQELKLDLRRLLPDRSAPPAPVKGDYKFDPDTYTWVRKR